MHRSPVNRRRFLACSAAAAGGLLARNFAFGRAGCGQATAELADATENAKALSTAINAFAADLQPRLAGANTNTLFFSPFSIAAALALTSLGARGKTLQEMQQVLHIPENAHAEFHDLLLQLGPTRCGNRGFELTAANALWAMRGYPWRKEFLNAAEQNYGAGIRETDFHLPETARKQINDWVENETREKIKNLIPEGVIDSLTRLVVTNAVYFKGEWSSKFDKKLTKDAPFTRIDGTRAAVPLMAQTGEFLYGDSTTTINGTPQPVQVLDLPYGRNELAMRIYLPADARVLHGLARSIANGELGDTSLRMHQVRVSLPRFKVESAYSLARILKDLGMKSAFGSADFSGMNSGPEGLFISDVVHKAYVDVNEEGTEAAAATGVIMKAVSVPMVAVFRADRPFLFAIRDNRSGVMLFMGSYNGPG